MREGVLCWYPFKRKASVLDLSNSALTELLCNRCDCVVTCDEAVNKLFDYIIVLDPLDYSVDAMKELRGKLAPHGRLLLAYENPFALRYWAGKKAPNTEQPYDTLYGHGKSPLPSKPEMQLRLEKAGFKEQKWYYPLTDHWLTVEVYSDAYLPNEFLNQRFAQYVLRSENLRFDERTLYREIIRGGAFEFMCGAYLVEARLSAADNPSPVDYAAITAYREPAKRFATIVRNDGTVHKIPLHPDGIKSIQRIHENHEELARLGVNIVKTHIEDNTLVMPRIKAPTLWDYWAEKILNDTFDESEMISQFDRIHETIIKASKNGGCYWELVPANCFYNEESDELIFFDQEYYWENTSPDIAVARAIKSFDYSPVLKDEKRSEEWIKLLAERYGLSEKWDVLVESFHIKAFREVFGYGYDEYMAISG